MINSDKDISGILNYLKDLDSAALAYSGGVDSTLLLYLLKKSGINRILAVTAISETYNPEDAGIAKKHTEKLGVEHLIFDTKELESADFSKNTPERCYYCKRELFGKLRKIADEKSIKYALDGSHSDDLQDYRPGMRAAEEIGVVSPFKELRWDKEKIRNVSNELNIEGWERPATVCLASRVPYGTEINNDLLLMIGKAEAVLKDIGLKEVRVRSDGVTARIETGSDSMKGIMKEPVREKVVNDFLNIGFKFVSLDMEGFKSGKMNRLVSRKS